MAETDRILSKGLAAGYAGGTERQTVQRGPFQVESTSYITPDGGEHSDQWIAEMSGGGQEIARINGETTTRLHAGGTFPLETLRRLGLAKKDVIGVLKSSILGSEGRTRLGEDYIPDAQGDWQYSYRIIDREDEIEATNAKEIITYKGEKVFVHYVLNSPVK